MSQPPCRGDSDATHETGIPDTTPASPDDQATGTLADLGVAAELRAVFQSGEQKLLPLYSQPDQVVVGRGTACDWQLDDDSLSRKHATFRWNGRTGELFVEDLGSANGTRVNGRPARNEVAVRAGDSVQLGTVVVTLEPRSAAPPPPRKPLPDDQPTRVVSSHELPQIPDVPSDPGLAPVPAAPTVIRTPLAAAPPPGSGLTPIPAAPTVIRTPPPPGVRPKHPLVFRPQRDAARPEEPTRPWDPRAVLVRAPQQPFDGELMSRLKDAWRTNRRPFVLAGAAVWIAIGAPGVDARREAARRGAGSVRRRDAGQACARRQIAGTDRDAAREASDRYARKADRRRAREACARRDWRVFRAWRAARASGRRVRSRPSARGAGRVSKARGRSERCAPRASWSS